MDIQWVRQLALIEGLVIGAATAEAADVLHPSGAPDFNRTMLVLGIFCFFLAIGTVLYTYRAGDSWQRRVGSTIIAVGGGYIAGLGLWTQFGHRPTWVIAMAAIVTLAGVEVILSKARRWTEEQKPPREPTP